MSDWRVNDERKVAETLKETKERLEQLASNWSCYGERRPRVIVVDGREVILV